MTNRQLLALIGSLGIIASPIAAIFLGHSQLDSLEKCWTEACRQRVAAQEARELDAYWTQQTEAADAAVEKATRDVEAQKEAVCRDQGLFCD
jgi:hypothetical protein